MSRPVNFFAPGEWYHCYSRGIDKRIVFENKSDYQRFISLLYLANSSLAMCRSQLGHLNHHELLAIPRGESFVSIGAYTLMPNHFHLLLYEKNEGGISTFMQKLGTAYTMYFNIKHERSGGLFTKPFRAQHVSDDRYLQYVVDYIHLNSSELFKYDQKEADTSRRRLEVSARLLAKVEAYPFSSLPDFNKAPRPEKALLGEEIFDTYQKKATKEVVENALAYAEMFSG